MIVDPEEQLASDPNSCGVANTHEPVWFVSMTSPEGRTGLTVRKCHACVEKTLNSVAVQSMDRTVHLRRLR
jgi:hypothetical protein